jgi:GNAT superfamily N-acetyltransferase
MHLEQLIYSDLYHLNHLQPDGWPDIVPAFKFYIDSDYCLPLKAIVNDQIVGLGACTINDDVAWLAHIIVSTEHRNKGVGFQIVDKLIKYLQNKSVNSILLIATELGMPVYLKAGFRVVSDYQFFRREKEWKDNPISKNIVKFEITHRRAVLDLDYNISGETRSHLFIGHLHDASIYLSNNKVAGLYVPGLNEGFIVADSEEAGIELMKLKYATINKAVLPSENLAGIEFLMRNGFVPSSNKGTRMVMGQDIVWQPEKIYSRISGNFG